MGVGIIAAARRRTLDGSAGSADAGIVAAVYFTVSGTTPTVVGQKNVASVTRQAAGVYRITFTSALANTNYGLMGAARKANDTDSLPMIVQPNRDSTSGNNTYSTTTVDVVCQKPNDAGTATDPALCGVVLFDPQTVSSSNYGAAASWTVSGTTVTLQRALNVTSMAREAAGVYRTNFTSALANANYSEFAMSRFGDFTNIATPAPGQNRNTTIPSNLHSTSALDLCTGHYNTTGSGAGNFDTARGSVLIGESNVAPRGTVARVRFSVSGGVVTIVESYNVASVTRSATGLFRVNFSTAASDTDYAVFGSGKWADSTDDDTPIVGADCNNALSHVLYSTAGVDIATHNVGTTLFDPDTVNIWVLKPWLM